jgi:hypothetical protein
MWWCFSRKNRGEKSRNTNPLSEIESMEVIVNELSYFFSYMLTFYRQYRISLKDAKMRKFLAILVGWSCTQPSLDQTLFFGFGFGLALCYLQLRIRFWVIL